MAARDIAGTIREIGINGVIYRVAADCNISMPISNYETSAIASVGDNMLKMVKRPLNLEGIVLITNSDERTQLKIEAESLSTYALRVTNAAGDTDRATGKINIESHETEENRTAIQMIPVNDWTTSVAEVS